MQNALEIKNDAIFIADSHTQTSSQNRRDSLILALQRMCDSNAIPSQIFLLGDISNILVGNVNSSVKSNKALIDAIDSLSKRAQIIYFEGNHDFNLGGILPSVRKIPRKNQPLLAKFGKKRVLIAHGDIFLNKKYEIYIKMLSAKWTCKMLQMVDFATFGRLYNFIEKKVQSKKIRFLRESNAICALVQSRIQNYKNYIDSQNLQVDLVIEGHFHLGKIVGRDSRTINTQDSCESASFCHSERGSAKNPKDFKIDSSFRTSCFTQNDGEWRDSRESSAKNCPFIYVALPSFLANGEIFCIKKCDFTRLVDS